MSSGEICAGFVGLHPVGRCTGSCIYIYITLSEIFESHLEEWWYNYICNCDNHSDFTFENVNLDSVSHSLCLFFSFNNVFIDQRCDGVNVREEDPVRVNHKWALLFIINRLSESYRQNLYMSVGVMKD